MLNRRQKKNLKPAVILAALSFLLSFGLAALFLVAALTVLTDGAALFNPAGGCLVAFVSLFAAIAFAAYTFEEVLNYGA